MTYSYGYKNFSKKSKITTVKETYLLKIQKKNEIGTANRFQLKKKKNH